jgi:hypothetical protein
VVIHRDATRLTVPLAWSTPPTLAAAPDEERLAPFADVLALLLLAALAAVAIRWAATSRRRHAVPVHVVEDELRIPEDAR